MALREVLCCRKVLMPLLACLNYGWPAELPDKTYHGYLCPGCNHISFLSWGQVLAHPLYMVAVFQLTMVSGLSAVLPAEVFPTTCHFFLYPCSWLFPFRQSLASSPVAIFCTEHVPEETRLDKNWDILIKSKVVSPNGYSFFMCLLASLFFWLLLYEIVFCPWLMQCYSFH